MRSGTAHCIITHTGLNADINIGSLLQGNSTVLIGPELKYKITKNLHSYLKKQYIFKSPSSKPPNYHLGIPGFLFTLCGILLYPAYSKTNPTSLQLLQAPRKITPRLWEKLSWFSPWFPYYCTGVSCNEIWAVRWRPSSLLSSCSNYYYKTIFHQNHIYLAQALGQKFSIWCLNNDNQFAGYW